jgi:hypothetical protein
VTRCVVGYDSSRRRLRGMVVDFKQVSWANPVLNPFLDSEGRTEVVWGITEIVKELELELTQRQGRGKGGIGIPQEQGEL